MRRVMREEVEVMGLIYHLVCGFPQVNFGAQREGAVVVAWVHKFISDTSEIMHHRYIKQITD